jgi:hypothetical protein
VANPNTPTNELRNSDFFSRLHSWSLPYSAASAGSGLLETLGNIELRVDELDTEK